MTEVEKGESERNATTGLEWDGITELNNPIPRWMGLTFAVCVVWAIGYWIVYPAWPWLSGYTAGVLGYSSRAELVAEMAAAKQDRSGWLNRFETVTLAEITGDSELLAYAMAGGRVIFADNCAPCHGAGGGGALNYPSVADDAWLWGGTLEDIQTTITYGVRSDHEESRYSEMPSFAVDETLTEDEIATVAGFVLSLSGGGATAGRDLYLDNCAFCHGEGGQGIKDVGAPNLADAIWLYGGDADSIVNQIKRPKHGIMPAWTSRLDGVSIKQVAVYVHSLGGGE